MVRRLWIVLAVCVATLALGARANAAPAIGSGMQPSLASFADMLESDTLDSVGWGPASRSAPRPLYGHLHQPRWHAELHLVHGAGARALLRSLLRAEAHTTALAFDDDDDDSDDDDLTCPGGGADFGYDDDLEIECSGPRPTRAPAPETVAYPTDALGLRPASGHVRATEHPPRG